MTSRVESSAGEIARGLVKKEGDTLHLIYALPAGEIPAEFKTREKQLMFVMKKEGDDWKIDSARILASRPDFLLQ